VVSIERETFPALLAAGNPLWAYKSSSYWIDIGTPAAFLKASRDLVQGQFHSPVFATSPTMNYVHPDAHIGVNVQIDAGSSVGASQIGGDVLVEQSIIGDDVVVGSGAHICASIIGDGVQIGDGAHLRGVVIAGAGVSVPPNSRQIGEI